MPHELKRTIRTPLAPAGRGPFPQAVAVGPFVFVSGQGPLAPETNEPIAGSFDEQVLRTFSNLEAILAAAGLELSHVAKVTVYLADLVNVPAFNRLYERLMPAPMPARTLVAAGLRGIEVEIDVIAVDPARLTA